MSKEDTTYITEKGKVKTDWKTLVVVVGALITGAIWWDRRCNGWEGKLDRMETHCWRLEDQVNFCHELEKANGSLMIPETSEVVRKRMFVLKEPKQGGE